MTCVIRFVSAVPAALMSPNEAGHLIPIKITGTTDINDNRKMRYLGNPSKFVFWKFRLIFRNSQKPCSAPENSARIGSKRYPDSPSSPNNARRRQNRQLKKARPRIQ